MKATRIYSPPHTFTKSLSPSFHVTAPSEYSVRKTEFCNLSGPASTFVSASIRSFSVRHPIKRIRPDHTTQHDILQRSTYVSTSVLPLDSGTSIFAHNDKILTSQEIEGRGGERGHEGSIRNRDCRATKQTTKKGAECDVNAENLSPGEWNMSQIQDG